MVFSSISFIFYFLPIFFLLYFQGRFKNLVLLLASLVFYAWGEVEYSAILLFSITINYFFGLMIARGKFISPRLALTFGIMVNLSLLIYFKYANFIMNNLNMLLPDRIGPLHLDPVRLPLGISFFTFHALSYLIDVYRHDAEVEKNPITLSAYITMFPQLVAGPIIRYQTIFREFRARTESLENFTRGIKFFVIGLGQKVLIANTLAVPADAIFNSSIDGLGWPLAWLGAICFTLQIYFDFLGYSNMAVGLGLMLGFHVPQNFNYPYISDSITEFWRRWHITLSRWFRDYLYIPLGGNRTGNLRTYLNLLIVFFLCGLWHGANWTFIAWGLYYGLFLIIERMGFKEILIRFPVFVRHVYVMVVVILGWVLFRSNDIQMAAGYIKTMFGFGAAGHTTQPARFYLENDVILALMCGIVGSMPWAPVLNRWFNAIARDTRWEKLLAEPVSLVCLTLVMALTAASLASGTSNPFIYFRF
ncbi:MAG: MBOAT family protein [Deltaproteobacteria bacterium]|nr:MBOAT family protein [Deltaproteobacteria bacterium]